jgi:hypothetical protein
MSDGAVVLNQAQLNKITKKLNNLSKQINNREILNVIGQEVKDNIFFRTNAGKDVNYNNFKSYAPSTIKKKGTSLVNLTDRGIMLKSMIYKVVSNNLVKIAFSNDEARFLADIHNNKGAGRSKVVRKFFGVNDKDEKLARSEYLKSIKKYLD